MIINLLLDQFLYDSMSSSLVFFFCFLLTKCMFRYIRMCISFRYLLLLFDWVILLFLCFFVHVIVINIRLLLLFICYVNVHVVIVSVMSYFYLFLYIFFVCHLHVNFFYFTRVFVPVIIDWWSFEKRWHGNFGAILGFPVTPSENKA